MNLELTTEEAAFRDEVRSFLKAALKALGHALHI
jgi:hypothetical protein